MVNSQIWLNLPRDDRHFFFFFFVLPSSLIPLATLAQNYIFLVSSWIKMKYSFFEYVEMASEDVTKNRIYNLRSCGFSIKN
jgi:hypothetical protein